MDLEPGRCRRTDGKKWRCRQAVLPDQKYCERHIHRGCLRSRKHVEDHKILSTAKITISPLKTTINLQPATKSDAGNHNNVCIKNHSFKLIKKRSREDAQMPIEFTFLPKTVQNGNVPESERCRRTDGKNWRCTKSTLQGQKYCAQHMHRGAKKVQNHQNSNTSLSFSVGASYQQKGNSDPNGATNSSSSDATTISM